MPLFPFFFVNPIKTGGGGGAFEAQPTLKAFERISAMQSKFGESYWNLSDNNVVWNDTGEGS